MFILMAGSTSARVDSTIAIRQDFCQTESLRKEDAELLDPLNARGGPV
jgi:hypothetical protein